AGGGSPMAMQLMSADKRLKTKEGEPILLGYDVYNGHGERLGRVSDLIVDTESMKVPFAVVDLEQDERRVILPMWEVEIDRNGQRLICPGCDEARLRHLTAL